MPEGHRLTADEAEHFLTSRGAEVLAIIAAADDRGLLTLFRYLRYDPFACGKAGQRTILPVLLSGLNDLAGTPFTGDVNGDAGASVSDYPNPKNRERTVTGIGRKLTQRTTLYECE